MGKELKGLYVEGVAIDGNRVSPPRRYLLLERTDVVDLADAVPGWRLLLHELFG